MKLLEPPVFTRTSAFMLLTLTFTTVFDRAPGKFADMQTRFVF